MRHHRGFAADDAFYGAVTVGERGQIVIPAGARTELGIQAGDKLLVMRHPVYKGLMICKIDELQSFLNEFAEFVKRMEDSAKLQEEEA
ncbi:MAG: AbrB/MazE/SpoVT family DNA-binding domain-containing protein [Fimbriimonadales bacterium]|nr:AbrB/MazE/SpoVT family DNA-binding domain-containing protein [Fimbriimonadales bacterium]